MKNKTLKIFACLIFCTSFSLLLSAQENKEKLGDKEYIIIKDYKPVLGESFKISDSPEGDTSLSTPPGMEYNIRSKKITSEYELSTIKAIKIKEELLAKLYRSYLKLGLGNYTTYAGDFYINALRSKKGALGLALNHFSGNPGLSDAGPAGFSESHAGVYGKYFLDNSTFSGKVDYNRDVVHYYGYDADTIISKDDLKQRFNKFGMQVALSSNYLSQNHLDYSGTFGFSSINDLYEVSENDILISGKLGKKVNDYYLNGDISFNYFKKSLAKYEPISLYNDLSRSLVVFIPTISFNKDKVVLNLGLNIGIEKNLDTEFHLFPKIDMSLPIAENILYVFAGVNGKVIKNSYQTIVEENSFVTSSIIPENTIEKLELKGGINGNFSSLFSFMTMVKYTTVDRMLLYVNDSIYFNKFNSLYIDGKVLNLHAEISYNASERFIASFRFDQYGYSMDQNEKAWQKPNTEMALNCKYNFWDKLILNASVYARGKYFVRIQNSSGYVSEKVDGFLDANLGIEYRYSKILSLYINFNNLGFAREYQWYNYPSERLNVLGGIKYSF